LLGVEILSASIACTTAFIAGFLFGVYATIEAIARELRRLKDEKQKPTHPTEDSDADV
jgi:hypothetical protein